MRVRGAVTFALMTAVLVALSYQRPVTFAISPATAHGLEGFGRKGFSQGRSWRWTSAQSSVRFSLAGQVLPGDAVLRLDLGLPRWAATTPRRVILALDGQPLGAVDVPAGFRHHEFNLPRETLSSGDWVLSLSTPGADLDPDDPRGIALARVELVQSSFPAVPAFRTLFLAVLGILALHALCGARLTPGGSAAVAVLAVVAVTVGLALVRPQVVVVLPWVSPALMLLAAGGVMRRSLSPPAAERLAGLAPVVTLVALVVGWAGAPPLLFLGIALGGMVLARSRLVPVGESRPRMPREWVLVLALSALAFGLRLYRLEEIPFAIFRDEARHGLLALRLLDEPSYRPLFLGQPINQPLPYFLFVAAALKAFGSSLFALRVVSAVAGALAVPLLYGLVREILGRRAAFVAALLLAASSWQISISRFAVNYVEPSLFSLPAYWLLWSALPQARLFSLCLAALLLGLGQYSAHTAKALLVVTAGLVMEEVARRIFTRDFAGLRRLGLGLLLATGVGVATVAPILAFVRENPADYLARAQQVSVLGRAALDGESGGMLLLENLRRYAGAFHVSGDRNGRHHLPRAPFLDPVAGLGLLAGLGLALTRPFSRASRFLLLWLGAGLLPGLLTVDAPSALRTIEAAPAVYAVAALGLVALWDGRHNPTAPGWKAVPALLLSGAVVWNGWVYFVRMYHSPAVWLSSAAIGTQVGKRLRDLKSQGLLPGQALLEVPRAFGEDPDNRYVLRFFWPSGLKIGYYDDPGSFSPRVNAILLPNEADLWRMAATENPASAAGLARALADEARWRERLGTLPGPLAEAGPPFPGTDRPSFWLYLPAGQP